jgi:tocopherol O-methyltransferase
VAFNQCVWPSNAVARLVKILEMAIQSICSKYLSTDGACPPSLAGGGYEYRRDDALYSPSLEKLVAYYESKTEAILQRYGPGPRVHFHTGFTSAPSPAASVTELRSQLVEAQERMLHYAADAWQLSGLPFGDVLDVGCGLGGGAIFWAQEFGAKVTAVTIAPSHIELVRKFAAQAGVGARVTPVLCDALSVRGESCFDAATVIDSSSSFPRREWFQQLGRLLRPGGRVFIFDCFLVSPEFEAFFNRHWCAVIGTLEEYLSAAREGRFTLDMFEDVSHRALHFWTTTLALIRAEAQDRNRSKEKAAKLEESLQAHALMRRGLNEGGLRHGLMSFVRD